MLLMYNQVMDKDTCDFVEFVLVYDTTNQQIIKYIYVYFLSLNIPRLLWYTSTADHTDKMAKDSIELVDKAPKVCIETVVIVRPIKVGNCLPISLLSLFLEHYLI